MSRRAWAAPLAFLPAGCLARETTPSGPLESTPYTPPAMLHQLVPPTEAAAVRWQLAADNPWAPYSKLTLLSWLGPTQVELELPDVRTLATFSDSECAAAAVAAAGIPQDTMWIVDLRGADSVAFGAALTRYAREPVSPVVTFNNWPEQNEIVPAEETLAALLQLEPRLPSGSEPGAPVFLLDAWRLAYRDQKVDAEAYDNRYLLSAADLPDAQTLQARHIQNVVYLVEDASVTTEEEEDLHPMMLAYQAAGLSVSLVDVKSLCRPPPAFAWTRVGWSPQVWFRWRQHFWFRVDERRHCSTQALYTGSPGGFGGAHAFPIHFASGVSGTAHGFGG